MFLRPGLCGIGIGRLGLVAAAVRQLFEPRLEFFSNGEQGVWYDPSDMSTLFQDSAGTTPVTAVEQPVGRMLDKSGRGNHAFQSTAIDRPILRQDAGGRYYLAANGTNTWMKTNAIDFTATDKVTVFAGFRRGSNSGDAVIFETSPSTWSSNPGSFAFFGTLSNAARIGVFLRGQTLTSWQDSGLELSNYIASARLNLAGATRLDEIIPRLNGAFTGIYGDAANAGTGNLGNHVLYLFRRGGTLYPFNGHFYGLLIRGALTSDAQIIAMERWLAPKTGVTL